MPHGMHEWPAPARGDAGMRLYRFLDRLRLPGGYPGKFFALGFVAVHLPLLAALGVAALRGQVDWVMTSAVLLATLLGTAAALWGMHALLAPVRRAQEALAGYAATGTLPSLPVTHRDAAGRLMAGTQDALAALDAALAAVHAETAAADAGRERALAEVTHELRTPLVVVLGYAELLEAERHGPLGHPRYASFAAEIAEGGRHMLGLIEDLQRFARVRAGKEVLELRPLPLAPLLERAAGLLHGEAERAGQRLELAVVGAPAAQGDARALMQVLLNLLGNAVRYAGPGARLRLSAALEGNEAVLRVEDDGPGMDEAARRDALAPFGRAGRRGGDGSGLGLPLVAALVALHGGRFALDSAPGSGTVATVALPAAAPGDAGAAG